MTSSQKAGYFGQLLEAQTYKNWLYFCLGLLQPALIGLVVALVINTDSRILLFLEYIPAIVPLWVWIVLAVGLGLLVVWAIVHPNGKWARVVLLSPLLLLVKWLDFERWQAKVLLSADIPPALNLPQFRQQDWLFQRIRSITGRDVWVLELRVMFSLATLMIIGGMLYITGSLLIAPILATWQPAENRYWEWRDGIVWTGSEGLKFTAASSVVAFLAGIPMLVLTIQTANALAGFWKSRVEWGFSSDKSTQKAVQALENAASSVLSQNTQTALHTILQEGLTASSATGAGIGEIQINLQASSPITLPVPLEQNKELLVQFPYKYSSRDQNLWVALGTHASTTLKLEQLLGAEREQERARIARELHDSVAQALYGIALGTRSALEHLQTDPENAQKALEYARDLADAGTSEMKTLLFALRPDALEEGGLAAALAKLGEMLELRYKLVAVVTAPLEPDLPLEHKGALYRIAQEAAHNTVKHAKAKHVWIVLSLTRLEVCDDGKGFEVATSKTGLGLKSMRERTEKIGAVLVVTSSEQGTQILVDFGGAK